MPATYGPTSPQRFATYDPDSSSWKTWPDTGLWGSDEYSRTWPRSGTWDLGAASEPATSAHPTSANGSSSSPGLPTPRARDSKGRGWEDGLPAVVELLPTPTVSEGNGTGPPDSPRNDTLRAQVALLPTPRASPNENRQTKRTPSQEAGKHGLNLAAEVCTLLPTPRATDGSKGGPNQRGSSGDLMLPSAVAHLLPTPRASDTGTPGRRASDGWRPPLSQALLPTPMANDSGNTPQNHLRKKPGRTQVTSLQVIADHGLISTGGRMPQPSNDGPASSDGQLLIPWDPPPPEAKA